MSSPNPYAAPTSAIPVIQPATEYPLASKGQRLANYFIDNIVLQVLCAIFGFALGIAYVVMTGPEIEKTEETQLNLLSFAVNIGIMILYYVGMEAAFGRTVGKFASGTKVVDDKGRAATFGKIVGRTFCRFIPFEPFSFLGADAVGWHDSISGTRVVKIR